MIQMYYKVIEDQLDKDLVQMIFKKICSRNLPLGSSSSHKQKTTIYCTFK
ncbi:sporulation histidine kinase inhibitor Sda [Paenibacillus sp. QZ-Y1]